MPFALRPYLQSDPIGLAGGLNTYTYARNNPLRYIDPEGLFVPQLIGGGIGAVSGAISGGIGGLTASGGKLTGLGVGIISGSIAGGLVGAAAPTHSPAAGAIVSNSVASLVGQLFGSKERCGRLDPSVVDLVQAAFEGFGGGLGRSVGILKTSSKAQRRENALLGPPHPGLVEVIESSAEGIGAGIAEGAAAQSRARCECRP